ncbi:GNAT family N-acetyltransferase [Microbacterium sp. NPDC056003]|uniref:GNAT family N-acetyltransferase n=1 Tax=Microbacterium sp. NPDC056003 TaxID=3345676 RepID=UPI0035DA8DAC
MQITLAPWRADDLEVLRRANTAELTRFLGGPEPEEALAQRHAEYLDGESMFRVEGDGVTLGYAGWWEQEHEGAPAYEVGCVIEPAWQGRGVASAVLTEVVRRAVESGDGRPIVGYAHVGNKASHALCRRVGFELEGTGVFPGEDGGAAVEVAVWVIRP